MLQFLSHYRGQRILFNGLLFTQEIPDEIIICMDYNIAFMLEKLRTE